MLIDSHCHLADDAYKDDLAHVVTRAQAAGVRTALCILAADEAVEVARASAVGEAWAGVCFATAVHPHKAAPFAGRSGDAAEVTRAAAGRVGAVALGEMGLDYHYDFAPRSTQVEVFDAQVRLALDLDLPVIIHTREASEDTFLVLRGAGRGRLRGVMHCFTGTMDDARAALDLGFYVSFSGIVTFPRAQGLREVAAFVPAERLLVETDAPYLAPVPHRGARNEPAWVRETLAVVAGVRGVAADELAAQIAANFAAFIGRQTAS